MPELYDVAVIGLGAMGSAVLYHLAGKSRVIGIDQHNPPHDFGSSHGESRITRQAIGEGREYVPLVLRSNLLWRQLEAESGADLFHRVGCLMIAPKSGTNLHHKPDFMQQTLGAAKEFGIDHEILDADEVRKRFPQFSPVGDEAFYYEPGGGYLRPEKCVATQLQLAEAKGAEILNNTKVTAIEQQADHVRISFGDESILAGRVIVSAGAGAATLLGDPIASYLKPTRQVLHWFPVEARNAEDWRKGPVYIWIHGDDEGDFFYGFPEIDGAGVIKVADEADGEPVNYENVEREVPLADSQRMFDAHLAGRLNNISGERSRALTCLYTYTRNGRFLIDEHPGADRILVVSPCSGHGFKHSAAIGEAVALRALDEPGQVDLSPFALAHHTPYPCA